MVRCSCGTDNLEKKFCTDCGKQLLYDCEKCKKLVAITEKFCGTCGTKNPHYDANAFNTRPR
jgi:predicted amidophosphoribosyltransferase